MQLAGLQKLTLLDYPGQVACTVFTCGCNFRCPFCHNAPLVLPGITPFPQLEEEDVLAFLKKRRGILDAVAVSGGEPLMQKDIGIFLAKIRSLGYKIKLDTNGCFPDMLRDLVRDNLVDRVAMDIKNAPALYRETAGTADLDMAAVERSKDFLLSGKIDYEFRTTVVRGLHSRESLIDAAKWIHGARAYYLQQFKDSGNIIRIEGLSAYNEQEMRDLAKAVEPYVPCVQVRGI